MKTKLIAVFIVMLLVVPSLVMSEKIGLEWDPVEGIDGYYIYMTIREWNEEKQEVYHEYDYTSPLTTEDYPDGKIPKETTQITVDLPGREDNDTKYMFVARSFLGDETSVDSNEVSYYVSLVPPFPADELMGSYDKDESIIYLSWSQPADEKAQRKISHWIIYYRIDGGEWVPIGRINEGNELKMDAPFDAVAAGEQKDVEFTIVTYRRSGIYSSNSQTLTINVDRKLAPPVQNLRINIEIPVI